MKPNCDNGRGIHDGRNSWENGASPREGGPFENQGKLPPPVPGNLAFDPPREKGAALGKREIVDFYRTVAEEIYSLIPGGPAFPGFSRNGLQTAIGVTGKESGFSGRSCAWERSPHETP